MQAVSEGYRFYTGGKLANKWGYNGGLLCLLEESNARS